MNTQSQQKLYVGNLHFNASEEEVKALFANYGQVEEVKIIMDRFSGRSRGFAFVRMAVTEDANKAKEALHGQPFQGKALIIDWARAEQRDRPAGGGGFGGERGERSSGGFGGGRERGNGEFRQRRDREWGGERRERGGDRDRFYR